MYKLIKRREVLVTPKYAEELLVYNTYTTQRVLRPAHSEELGLKMKLGVFRFGEVALAYMHNNIYMMNGQHVCTAIIEAGIPQTCILEEFQVANKLDMSLLYQQFEILPRSLGDMVKVQSDALELLWPSRLANLVVSAACILEANTSRFIAGMAMTGSTAYKKHITRETKVGYLEKYVKEGEFIVDIFLNSTVDSAKHLKRAPVAAMMMKTWQKSNKNAYTFWMNVRDGENLVRQMPEWHLREFLMGHRALAYRGAINYRKATNHEVAYRSTLLWNAFRRGESISKTVYHPNKNIPILV